MAARFRLSMVAVAAAAFAFTPTPAFASGFGRGGAKSNSGEHGGRSKSKNSSNAPPPRQGTGFGRTTNGGSGYGGYSRGAAPGYRYGAGSRTTYRSGAYDHGAYDHGAYTHGSYDRYHVWHEGYGYGYRPAVVVHPYYSRWGIYPYGYYGYGYYPYWGAPPIAEAPQAPKTTTVELFGGALMGDSPAVDASLGIDGEQWGFNLRGTVLGNADPSDPSHVDSMPLTTAHLTYSLIADPHARVRVELGASAVVAPQMTYYGPDVGASAQLAILGPIGIEGSAHLTPTPARILDLEADAALHFGALGLKVGWRMLSLDDTGTFLGSNKPVNPTGGGTVSFSGPEAAVGLVW